MGTIDVPKVIQAAATSNLGVISLLALVLAFLAWRFFQRSGDKVKLIAFGMMFIGAIGFGGAVLTATGKPEVARTEPVPGATPSSDSAPDPSPLVPTETPAPSVAATAAPDIAGAWHDADGYQYLFRQKGAAFDYESRKDGKRTGSGSGTLSGDRMTYRYHDDATADDGNCTAQVAADRRSIEGKCSSGGSTWDFRIDR